jgi:hypothetical protein
LQKKERVAASLVSFAVIAVCRRERRVNSFCFPPCDDGASPGKCTRRKKSENVFNGSDDVFSGMC